MGNCCGCNIANRINGLNIMILCVVVVINFWYEFDSAQGLNCSQYSGSSTQCVAFEGCGFNTATNTCEDTLNRSEIDSCMKELGVSTCGGRFASGIFATIGALVALFGAISNNPERNESTIAAAFALINLAHAAYLFGEHENPLQKELRSDQIISGVSNVIGALCGIFYACWSCRSGDQTNNLAKIMATFFYAFSFTVTSWKLFDDSCNSADLKDGGSSDDVAGATQGRALDGDACTMQAFGGVFGLACMLFCIFAAVQVCCKQKLQPKFQSFIICLSYGMIFGYWLSLFWYRFANATTFGEAACNTSDPSKSNKGFCFTQFLGGATALAGMPLAVITGLLFCMGCISSNDDDEEYNPDDPYGV